ncbi:hypothetical protein [Helicobacter pylori]|uniref:hypothetical protein n=1 Tax=Helicobacter pylori TaxID=210 RepID=UPI001884777D|nr:hypothetical protein [Helicobacter pylori]
MEALALFLWGENLELLGFLVVAGGYLKKCLSVLSLLSYRVKISFKLALSMSD